MPFSDYKTALVTGASSGIGAAVVERLRSEGLRGPRAGAQRRARWQNWPNAPAASRTRST